MVLKKPKLMISKIPKENKAVLFFLIVVILGLPFSVLVSFFLVFNQKVYPQVFLCQQAITGKNKKESQTIVETLIKESPLMLKLVGPDQTFSLDLATLNYNPQKTIETVFKIGREKSFFLNLKQVFRLFRNKTETQLAFDFDENTLDQTIASISATLYQAAVNPEIKVVGKGNSREITVEPGKNGQDVDKRALRNLILNQISCPQNETSLAIPIIVNSPKISPQMVEQTQKRATSFLDKKVLLKLDNQNWEINDEEIISFLSFDQGFDRSKISQYAQDFGQTINVSPENAAFQFENNQVVVFKPSKEGIFLQEPRFVDELTQTLESLELASQSAELEIPVVKSQAEISTGDANSLGIKEIVGQGTSLFYGSINERIHNLQLASLKLNGILIAPGEVFSFNKALGDVSSATGFKQAYIIKDGRTVLGDGGGVCQVSTTLFRAALNAGLPITERHAHAYRVHYYEDDLGPGFDATVFDPSADLKIENNTSAHLLIQTNTDLKKKQLTFNLYGTKDNRKVELSKARVWDKQPPPPDLYQDDPTLPIGVIKQIDWKAWGAKAAFDYKVTRDGETLFEKTFSSNYKPWQSIYLRGTK